MHNKNNQHHILHKPKFGWVTFAYDDYKISISCLTDIPRDWLMAFRIYLGNVVKQNLCETIPLHVVGDCEGNNIDIVLDRYSLMVYSFYNDNLNVKSYYNINYIDFIEKICNDIESCVDDWSEWNTFYFDVSDDSIQKRKEEILEDIITVRSLVKEIKKDKMYY